MQVRRGAGAYICGEETALIESIEGHAGEPRIRPPYPVTAGLWGKPTVVNNVKTWASVAPILTRGAAWYAAMGTKRTPGTTIFSLEGAVQERGLVEVRFGISLRELVYEIGGGMAGDRPLKAVQAGGPSAGCMPASHARPAASTPKTAPARRSSSAPAGSSCWTTRPAWSTWPGSSSDFFVEESCGKCVPCREGTKQMLRILTPDLRGPGHGRRTWPLLERLAKTREVGGGVRPGRHGARARADRRCEHFRDEFESHIRDKQVSGRRVPHAAAADGVSREKGRTRVMAQRDR